MISQYSDLIDAAHMATGCGGLVKISSVCPRANDQIQTRIDAFNAGLSQLCSDRSVEFIDNDDNFKARNGSINGCLLLTDGVRLTTSESSLLASNLNVDVIITQKPRQHVRHQSSKQHRESEHNQRQQVMESQTQQRPLNKRNKDNNQRHSQQQVNRQHHQQKSSMRIGQSYHQQPRRRGNQNTTQDSLTVPL